MKPQPTQPTVASKLKAIQKRKSKKERFIRTRMWLSTIMAALYRDRGTIPANIGNNIMVGNNVYITKEALSAIILVKEMSGDTPVAFVSDLMQEVKSKVPDVIIDYTLKCDPHHFDVQASDMKSRIRNWALTLDSETATDTSKRRAARLLYTVDIASTGEQLYRARMYITVRAKTGQQLNRGVAQTCSHLSSIGAVYKIIKSDIKMHLDGLLLMSDNPGAHRKDLATNVMSQQTIAEILPATQGMNDELGTNMGIDRKMLAPYFINFRASSKAKNIIAEANSGAGKTFLVLNWLLDMFADGYNIACMDIKGTEFVELTKAVGGMVLSMGASSTYYINTWRLDKEEAGADSRVYFGERLGLSSETMLLLADLPENLHAQGQALVEEFLRALYLQLGVTSENVNTWYRSHSLTPYVVFDEFERFCSADIRSKYAEVADRMLTRLRIYMSRSGSNSHIFRDAYNYKDILDTRMLTFAFNMLGSDSAMDRAVFQVRALYMNLLNDQYVAHKYQQKQWTCKVLEESGIAADYLIKLYAKDFILRRAQNQVTILLGNSISALASNPLAAGILENANILVLGALNRSSRDYLVNEYGLEKECEELERLYTDPNYTNTFLLVNRMQKDATTALLKFYVPQRVAEGKLFKFVDTQDS